MDTPCAVQYHRPESGIKVFRCVLNEGHEGAHYDGNGNVGLSPDSHGLDAIEREIRRDLKERNDR